MLVEYGRVCQVFIDHFWIHGSVSKGALLKEVVDIPLTKEDPTWLGARFRKVAAREALDMISSVKKRWSHQPEKITKPTHRGLSMRVSSTIAKLQEAKEASEFDLWLHLSSIGEGVILDLPIRKHPHFKEMLNQGKRLNAYVISESHVQFAFSLDPKPSEGVKSDAIGVDTGIKKLAALSDGTTLGGDIEKYVTRITAAIDAGANQMRARRAMRHYMDGVANQIVARNPTVVVVEDLVNLKNGTKKRKRVNKSVRRKLGAWAYSYWLSRLEMTCERHRVPFVRVNPAYTSQMCNSCKHTDRSNRKGELFQCLSCGFEADADINAAKNILERYRSSQQGSPSQAKSGILLDAGAVFSEGKGSPDTVPVSQPKPCDSTPRHLSCDICSC